MLKSLFRRNAEVGSLQPTAAGRPARVPPGVCVYAIGDIHGRADLLAALHRLIVEDTSHLTPGTEKLVVYVGDYVDRGLESRQVIDLLLDRPLPEFSAVYLLGNHDAWLLSFLVDAAIGPTWLRYGGDATLHSYGVAVGLQRDDVATALVPGDRLHMPDVAEEMMPRPEGDLPDLRGQVSGGSRQGGKEYEDRRWHVHEVPFNRRRTLPQAASERSVSNLSLRVIVQVGIATTSPRDSHGNQPAE